MVPWAAQEKRMGKDPRRMAVALKAIISHEDKVLLLRRSRREELFTEMWDIPGGRMEWGEEPLEALRREILEETGGEADILAPVSVWQFQARPDLQVIGITFRCVWRGGEVRLGPEHDAFRWATPQEARGLHMESSLREEILQFGGAAER
jgi:8-oxo-dGTP diphosphatase